MIAERTLWLLCWTQEDKGNVRLLGDDASLLNVVVLFSSSVAYSVARGSNRTVSVFVVTRQRFCFFLPCCE